MESLLCVWVWISLLEAGSGSGEQKQGVRWYHRGLAVFVGLHIQWVKVPRPRPDRTQMKRVGIMLFCQPEYAIITDGEGG
jgi:hypothetical protein